MPVAMLVRELVEKLLQVDQNLPVMRFEDDTVSYVALQLCDLRLGTLVASTCLALRFDEVEPGRIGEMLALLLG